MIINLNQFLEKLNVELPAICTDKDLIAHLPNIFKNACTLSRMRSRDQTPPYFSIDPNYYYLRQDVIFWLRSRYQNKDDHFDQEEKKTIDKRKSLSEASK